MFREFTSLRPIQITYVTLGANNLNVASPYISLYRIMYLTKSGYTKSSCLIWTAFL